MLIEILGELSMTLPNLTHLSHEELRTSAKSLRRTEQKAIADMVLYLSEIESRRIYRDFGYPSLFSPHFSQLARSEREKWSKNGRPWPFFSVRHSVCAESGRRQSVEPKSLLEAPILQVHPWTCNLDFSRGVRNPG